MPRRAWTGDSKFCEARSVSATGIVPDIPTQHEIRCRACPSPRSVTARVQLRRFLVTEYHHFGRYMDNDDRWPAVRKLLVWRRGVRCSARDSQLVGCLWRSHELEECQHLHRTSWSAGAILQPRCSPHANHRDNPSCVRHAGMSQHGYILSR